MKTKMIKFNDLTKKDKTFRIVNLIIMAISFLVCLGLIIYYFAIGDPNDRCLGSIGIAVIVLLPYFFEIIFRRRLSNVIFLTYEIYAIFSGVLGVCVNFYSLIWFYDIVIHLIAGYVFSLLGILFLLKIEDYKKLNPWTIIVVCLSITLAIELIWEIAEWTVSLFGFDVQGEFVPGYNASLVTDTMEDILCNFIGGIVFSIHLIIGKFSKYNLGIKFYEKELATFFIHDKVNYKDNEIDSLDSNLSKETNINQNKGNDKKNIEEVEKDEK